MKMKTHDYRFEVKIPIPLNRLPHIENWLSKHSVMFKPHHENRQIHSLYLDTPYLARYEENLSGISKRKKVRIRWYGDIEFAENAKLEFKHRKAGKGYKVLFSTQLNFNQSNFSWYQTLKSMYYDLPLKCQLMWDTEHIPIIICSYERAYYISQCGRIRATIDTNIKAYDQRYLAEANLTKAVPLGDYVLLELKTQAENETMLSEVIGSCPLRPSRHSKYVNSIRNLMWQ